MAKTLLDRLSQLMFRQVHGRNLVYNTCWEDPRLDREALALNSGHNVLVITSAGCNALSYALDGPKHVHAVDMNPRQNALLDLKIAGIKALDYDEFFRMFGEGHLENPREVYQTRLRQHLPGPSRMFWDRNIRFFQKGRILPNFYYHGTSGWFARAVTLYLRVCRAGDAIRELFEIESPEERRRLYCDNIRDRIWSDAIRRFLGYGATLSLVGVPRPQRQQIADHYEGGVAQFIEDNLETVFTHLPTSDNYFWGIYLFGHYTRERCPAYLQRDGFEALKGGLVDRISTHTTTILDFLNGFDEEMHRFVLLDHMDWLSSYGKPSLEAEWQAIADRAATGARILWRSAAMEVDFVDPISVMVDGQEQRVGNLLHYQRELAERLHQRDRVHTYGSFHIADWVRP